MESVNTEIIKDCSEFKGGTIKIRSLMTLILMILSYIIIPPQANMVNYGILLVKSKEKG